MLISFVTGTHQRLPYLARMIASIRNQMPRHIKYEFCICDGMSTDGTREWLRLQPDVKLICHDALKGAIPAFCDAAEMATGTYTALLNDDIEVHPFAILRAISHLEDNRNCGMVAFADNRSQQMGRTNKHQTEGMPALNPDGTPSWVTYGQVAVVRTWLGRKIGWWGWRDEIMQNARTYGGDSWLSARIWELGYSIDPVDGCSMDDLIPRDSLRELNNQTADRDSRQYYQAYPYGPQLRADPAIPNPQHDTLRVIVCDIHDPHIPARTAKDYGLAEAFAKIAYTYHIDLANDTFDLPKTVLAWQPHLMFIQLHDTSQINAYVLSRARAMNPNMIVVVWNGDAHLEGLVSPEIIDVLRYADLQLVVNAAVLPTYEKLGIKANYWQIGLKEAATPYEGEVPQYDVLWQGNAYNQERQDLINTLGIARFHGNYSLGLYGNVPGTMGNSHYDFALQAALYRSATINIGDTFPGTRAFVSNRVIQCLGNGGFLLQQRSEGLQEYTGLTAGVHYAEWETLADLPDKIHYWLSPDQADARAQIAQEGCKFVRINFSYDAQIKKLWNLL